MKFRLRFLTYILIAVVLINSCFNACSFSVQASSIQSVEASAEIAMVIYEILESAAIAGGVKEGLSDYESGKTLYDSFIGALRSASLAGDPDWLKDEFGYVTLTDGNAINLGNYINDNLVDGSSALELPDENIWKKYRDGSAAFGIASVVLGTGLLSTLGSFMTDVFDDKIDGLSKDDYITSVGSWNYDRDADGHYLISGTVNYNPNSTQHGVYTLSGYVASYMPVAYFIGSRIYFLYLNPVNGVFYNSYSSSFPAGSFHANFEEKFDLYLNLDGSLANTIISNVPRYVDCTSRSYKLNIPVFESSAQALSHFENGTWDGLLNGSSVDCTILAAASASTLAALAGTSINPGSLAGFNKVLSEAATSASIAGTVADNTADYIDTLTSAITDFDFTGVGTDDKVDDLVDTVPALLKSLQDSIDIIPQEIIRLAEIVSPFPTLITDLKDSVDVIPGILEGWDESITGFPAALQSLLDAVSIFPSADLTQILKILPKSLDDILNGINSIPKTLLDGLTDVLTDTKAGVLAIPKVIADALGELLAAVRSLPKAIAIEFNIPSDNDSDNDDSADGGSGAGLPSLLNSLILIILILIALLRIFLHCLKFIICIFRIPASQGFLPDEMVMGLDYLKTLEITGMGISVFDFMMGLIHIMIIFGVVQLLRKVVDKIHLPHR